MAQISWEKSALDIHNQIRGMNPWPIAHADFRTEHLRILRSFPAEHAREPIKTPGTFLGHTQHGILVQCGDGTVLEILEVQMPAKHVVSGREFANGAHLQTGEVIFR
jgi:methionyl-tRNA formyltransferase